MPWTTSADASEFNQRPVSTTASEPADAGALGTVARGGLCELASPDPIEHPAHGVDDLGGCSLHGRNIGTVDRAARHAGLVEQFFEVRQALLDPGHGVGGHLVDEVAVAGLVVVEARVVVGAVEGAGVRH